MKQKVTNLETGDIKTVEAIDAREMVGSGGWAIGEVEVKKKTKPTSNSKSVKSAETPLI